MAGQSGIIRLDSKNTTYLMRINEFGHLENLYYGKRLRADASVEPLYPKRITSVGTGISYSEASPLYYLETTCLETSTPGKGDYRTPAIVAEYDNGLTTMDFIYKAHRVTPGKPVFPNCPAQSYANKDEATTVEIQMVERKLPIVLQLNYTVFHSCDTIVRSAIITNGTKGKVILRDMASLQLDLPDSNWDVVTFDGAWARERSVTRRHLESGIIQNSSNTGVSSAFHNPAIFLERPECSLNRGDCYAFNLIYSGNHREIIEKSPFGLTRVLTGINPQTFSWTLESGDAFTTPEAVMTYSAFGNNGASVNMHSFINRHIVRGAWKFRERPVLCNNWEATYFNFTETKILELAKASKELGVELFVLDDGWFGNRNDDKTSLGDWFVNTKKLPGGITKLSDKIHALGMMFGIWVEPEMISRRSLVFDMHPDWAVMIPERAPSVGRNQFILDYTRKDVRDYVVSAISEVLTLSRADYVKWDMNRTFSDIYSASSIHMGEFNHRYVMGLYEVFSRLTKEFPRILFEGCASGGNRFDLGVLCFMPQIWTSDDSDAYCRTQIQGGTSYAYPTSTMGAHVSDAPNHQTLRKTDIESRFNVAAFGQLGYEMDLSTLHPQLKQIVKTQIEFYKDHRSLFQFGRFYRLSEGLKSKDPSQSNSVRWVVANTDFSEMILLDFQILNQPNVGPETLRIPFARPEYDYEIIPRQQKVSIGQFGSLINMISPVHINSTGKASKVIDENFMLKSEIEHYRVSGDVLAYSGIRINPQFSGTGYTPEVRVLGDFGSRMYHIIRVSKKEN